jgi:hypothetical protein
MAISASLTAILIKSLLAQNEEYREETGNKWNCLTANHIVNCFDNIDEQVTEMVTLGAEGNEKLLKVFISRKNAELRTIKKWFDDNGEVLVYNTDGKIPWPIVRQLQRGLKLWSYGSSNPFNTPIEELIIEVASNEGIVTDDPKEAWVKMGGRLFTTEE